jgi:hypothetical protein
MSEPNSTVHQTFSLPIFCVLLLAAPAAGAPPESSAMNDPRIADAVDLMDGYARRTGLASAQPSRRYLWTDAFAVCNFLGLARATGERRHLDLAIKLVDAVHRQLGRHRRDDGRSGWLSGLEGEAALRHPTRGGLRIGKPLPERGAGEPLDRELEWQRDGQYFHYLGKWMHASTSSPAPPASRATTAGRASSMSPRRTPSSARPRPPGSRRAWHGR